MKGRTYTPEEVEKKFQELPVDIQSLVYSVDMINLVAEIGKKYQLHIDQLEIVESETADVMTGYSQPNEFASNLAKGLNIDQTKAEALAKDINDQLFVKIRESLKKLYEKPAAGAIVNPPYTPPTASPKPAPAPEATPVTPPTPIPPPVIKPVVPPPPTVVPTPPKPTPPELQEMLSKPTISTQPIVPKAPIEIPPTQPTPAVPKVEAPKKEEPPKPGAYTTDPYREIPE